MRLPLLLAFAFVSVSADGFAATVDSTADGDPLPAERSRRLDADVITSAIVKVRQALPPGWAIEEIDWNSVPTGWTGAAECVLVRCEDRSIRFPHPDEDFSYHPFYKLWFLAACWEGRMAVTEIERTSPQAVYLGETPDFRVLYRTLGRNTWPEAHEVLAEALALDSFPLTHSPRHSLDVSAMQRLFQRLDVAGHLDRFQQQIYGITELPDIIYLELLTWEDRDEVPTDPTHLGDIAETETRYLSRELLAAFPKKRGVYLRRVTQATFSDVLVVNPAYLAPAP